MSNKDYTELGRVGVVDVGSNSVRLVVFDGAARAPAYFYNEKVLCGLGQGLVRTGKLNPEGKLLAIKTMKRFKLLADHMRLTSLGAVATAAVREAEDGDAFCVDVARQTGIQLHAISGEEEARLAAKGVLLGWPKATGLICDLGGSSMEFAELSDGKIKAATTTALGPLSVIDLSNDDATRDAMIRQELEAATQKFAKSHDRLYLVGGSARAVAKYHMHVHQYPLHVLQDYALPLDKFKATLDRLSRADMTQVQQDIRLADGRAHLMPEAVRVLSQVVDHFDAKRVVFSSYGLREGLLYERLPKGLQSKDPLIEACKTIEQKSARFPGFGDHLYEWLEPLFATAKTDRKRLTRAACHLHDVNWQSHPDYRASVCFDDAMHSNLGGISHQGRVFIAWALSHRYGAKNLTGSYQTLSALLTERDRQSAVALGKAMRLGAMMSASNPDLLGTLRMTPSVLEIALDATSQSVFGEVVRRRFESLAKTLDRKPMISYAVK